MSNVKTYAAPLIYQNIIILPDSWIASTTYANYPYEATVTLEGVTEKHIPEVSFAPIDAITYMFAPNAITQDGSMTIYTVNRPDNIIIIPSILCVNGSIGFGGDVDPVLENNSWDIINRVAISGQASSIWNVGDTKKIVLNGAVGTLNLNNYKTYVYILGFDHNGAVDTIDFGTFKDSKNTDWALTTNLNYITTDGTLNFNKNHWGNFNYGGWAGCDMRYDILGSTDIPPSGYGSAPIPERTGYNASSTCTTNPVANTLMAALPSELRAVMKPMVIYTDNVAGGTQNDESNITATVDYLPLLAEFEIFGSSSWLNNDYEKNKQSQYTYYVNGNSTRKYYNNTYSVAPWWGRSSHYSSAEDSFAVHTTGKGEFSYDPGSSRGLAPIFRVGAMPIITFTINEKEYKAVFGMTWAEWCDSEYNTLGLFVNEYENICNESGEAIYFDGATSSNEFIEIDRAYNLGPL